MTLADVIPLQNGFVLTCHFQLEKIQHKNSFKSLILVAIMHAVLVSLSWGILWAIEIVKVVQYNTIHYLTLKNLWISPYLQILVQFICMMMPSSYT